MPNVHCAQYTQTTDVALIVLILQFQRFLRTAPPIGMALYTYTVSLGFCFYIVRQISGAAPDLTRPNREMDK